MQKHRSYALLDEVTVAFLTCLGVANSPSAMTVLCLVPPQRSTPSTPRCQMLFPSVYEDTFRRIFHLIYSLIYQKEKIGGNSSSELQSFRRKLVQFNKFHIYICNLIFHQFKAHLITVKFNCRHHCHCSL
jgi:hypothetical protein